MITQERLKELLSYNPESGYFAWIRTTGGAKKGRVAGTNAVHIYSGKSYRRIRIDGVMYLSHRLAWLYEKGAAPKNEIDHIDGDGCNNSISNLRSVTRTENSRNQKKYATNSSGCTGIYWCKSMNKWQARIVHSKKKLCLGRYFEKWDAICARKSAEFRFNYHKNHGAQRQL